MSQQNKIGDVGRSAEAATAKRLSAQLTPASGAMAGAKGDMVAGEFLIENKSSTAASMSLQHAWLAKISQEALSREKRPALLVQFTNGNGQPKRFGKWVMMTEDDFRELVDELR